MSKRSKRNKFLLKEYEEGRILQVDKDVDNKKYFEEMKAKKIAEDQRKIEEKKQAKLDKKKKKDVKARKS